MGQYGKLKMAKARIYAAAEASIISGYAEPRARSCGPDDDSECITGKEGSRGNPRRAMPVQLVNPL
jgi:hypothetical protein